MCFLKKVFAILLFAVLILHLLFSYAAYALLRFQAREAMEQKLLKTLPEHELALIKIYPANSKQVSFSWFNDDEFSYAEHMYDVVRKTTHGDTTYYYCLDDSREAKLGTLMDKQLDDIAQTGQLPTNNHYHFLKSLQKEYLQPTTMHAVLNCNAILFADITVKIKQNSFLKTFSPPPEVLA